MYIIKVGGGSKINLEGVASDLAAIEEPFLVVLGANALRDQLGQRLGREKVQLTSVSGYSSVFSDADGVDLIMMAYSGLSNRRFVEMCQKAGVNAVGLTGLDGRLIQGRRNHGIKVRQNGKTMIKRDFSAPAEVNVDLLALSIRVSACLSIRSSTKPVAINWKMTISWLSCKAHLTLTRSFNSLRRQVSLRTRMMRHQCFRCSPHQN